MMTQQDHDLIAQAIRSEHSWASSRDNAPDQDAAVGMRIAARSIAAALARDNPSFECARFLTIAIERSL